MTVRGEGEHGGTVIICDNCSFVVELLPVTTAVDKRYVVNCFNCGEPIAIIEPREGE